jgi:hygromycin-B 7''-O-kinase
MNLPELIDPKVFHESFRLDADAWRAAVVEVCGAHQLGYRLISPFRDGSNVVAEVDDGWIVKIFPPFHAHQWISEWRALSHLRGHELPVRVPRLLAHGTRHDGWHYAVIEKLPGSSLEDCWAAFSLRNKVRVLEQIGATMAAVHQQPLGELVDLPPEWDSFVRAQQATCRKRHSGLRVPKWFEEKLEHFVQTWGLAEIDEERVLLTGEYTPFNLLVTSTEEGWTLTGMIDFGDAMVGARDYDLLGPSMFSCAGDPQLIGALFRGYFGGSYRITHHMRMRLMALALLHRYANFDVQLRIANWRDHVDSLEALAELVWPANACVNERCQT